MDWRENTASLSKPLAHRLSAMMEAGLLTYREYIPWADAIITAMDRPPKWILDLSTTKYRPRATEIVRTFAHSEPFEIMSADVWVDEYIAAVYLRYERRELSWATFLEMAGKEADANGGMHNCEHFYAMLNAYELADFARPLESMQRESVLADYESLVRSVRGTFEAIRASRDNVPNAT